MLSQFLFPVVLNVIEAIWGGDRQINIKPDFSQFSYSWTVLIVFVIFFILTAKKDLSIFVHINKFGVVFALINTFFIIGVGIYAMMDSKFKYTIVNTRDQNSTKIGEVWNV